LILLYAALALNFIRLPKVAVTWEHDPGSHMSFEFYAREQAQFGLDVIQNVGPYGYLQYPHDYSGILPTQKLLFGIGFGLAVAWFALEARKYYGSAAARGVWFLALFFALVQPGEELDPISNLFLLLAAHHLLLSRHVGLGRFATDAVVWVLLGLLLLMKSTNVMLVGLLLLLVVVERVRTRRFLPLAWDLGWLGITVLGLWLHAGQKVSHAVAFMRGAMAFSKGYNEALATVGKPQMVWLGLVVLGLFALINALRFCQFRRYRFRLPLSLFEAACLFIFWKHGYVRAGHEVAFWAFMILGAPLLFLAHEPPSPQAETAAPRRPGPSGGSLWRTTFSLPGLGAVAVTITVLCTMCASRLEKNNPYFANYATWWAALKNPCHRIASNLGELADWPRHRQALQAELEQNREAAALPEVKKTIGDATIDEFGFLPGLILLNGFHYAPRPMPINFGATTGLLMRRNAEFYRNDATAPAYLLANIGQIDGRFAPQDDALALLEVLHRYQPLLADHGYLLLKRRAGQPNLERTPQDSRTIAWGERVALPSTTNALLWCAADIQYSFLGRCRAFLFHPSRVFIVLESQRRALRPMRLLPSGASTGFLLRPLILNGADFLAAYGIHAGADSVLTPPFDSLRLVAEDPDCFRPTIKLSFSAVEAKP